MKSFEEELNDVFKRHVLGDYRGLVKAIARNFVQIRRMEGTACTDDYWGSGREWVVEPRRDDA